MGEEEEDDADDPYADIPWDISPEADSSLPALAAGGTPFFSTFVGMKVEGKLLKRIRFSSRLQLNDRKPVHVFVRCTDCNARRTVEDPLDLHREDKGNTTGVAAVAICPTCCVLISN